MDYQLQVVTLSVRDVDEAAAFYTEQAAFTLDVDYHPAPGFRVVQLTPPGSARATYLAVTDIEAAHHELAERGVPVSAIRHKSPAGDWRGGWAPGPAADRRDYASQAGFADPDGNTWVIQEIGYRPPSSSGKDPG
jgi:catechol 2,3-dioxygenase-like lactoylglutathione lyase family enzyme